MPGIAWLSSAIASGLPDEGAQWSWVRTVSPAERTCRCGEAFYAACWGASDRIDIKWDGAPSLSDEWDGSVRQMTPHPRCSLREQWQQRAYSVVVDSLKRVPCVKSRSMSAYCRARDALFSWALLWLPWPRMTTQRHCTAYCVLQQLKRSALGPSLRSQ